MWSKDTREEKELHTHWEREIIFSFAIWFRWMHLCRKITTKSWDCERWQIHLSFIPRGTKDGKEISRQANVWEREIYFFPLGFVRYNLKFCLTKWWRFNLSYIPRKKRRRNQFWRKKHYQTQFVFCSSFMTFIKG